MPHTRVKARSTTSPRQLYEPQFPCPATQQRRANGKLGHFPGASPAPSAHLALGWAGPIFRADANILMFSHTCTAYCPIRVGGVGGRGWLSRPGAHPSSPSHVARGNRHPLQGRPLWLLSLREHHTGSSCCFDRHGSRFKSHVSPTPAMPSGDLTQGL